MQNFTSVIKKFSTTFWIANVMELFERWAWYGFYMALAIYLTASTDTGALGFTQSQKGLIMGTGSMLLYFLPVFTGAIADKIGYKKILILSFFMYITGYFMMAVFKSYTAIFLAYIYVAVAGALFKPIISATIAKTTNAETSSIGFGIFYMMVNIGGFIGPFIAGLLYNISWNYVFGMSMITIAVNYLFVFFVFKEPITEKSTLSMAKILKQAFINIIIALRDFKYLMFLLIMVGFWTAFNQLYYSFPVFLEQWGNTAMVYSDIYSIWPGLAKFLGTEQGTISAVTIGSFDAFFIILFQIGISTLVMRYKPLNAMIGGIFVLSLGLAIMFSTQNVWYLILGLLIFSLGEMASSPKFTEYVGRIAPSDKVALYMGTSFLPYAGAHQLSGILSGGVFQRIADKITLMQKYVAENGLNVPEISEKFTQNDYINAVCTATGQTETQLTNLLWQTYHPYNIWILFSAIGFGTAIVLFLYDKFILNRSVKKQVTY